MLSDLLQNICFPIEILPGSADGVDHIAPVDAGSTAPVSILRALQPLGLEAEAEAAGEDDAEAEDEARKRRRGGERGARRSAAASGLLESIPALL